MINDFFRSLDAVVSPLHKKLKKGNSCKDIITPRDEINKLILASKGRSSHSRNYNKDVYRNNSQQSILNSPNQRIYSSSPYLY